MFRLMQIAALAACLACPSVLLADFQYQETTQITGGSVMGLMKMAGVFSSQARKADQPVTSTVLVKGNRMARIRPDSMEIIDLDRGTITQIDTTARNAYAIWIGSVGARCSSGSGRCGDFSSL